MIKSATVCTSGCRQSSHGMELEIYKGVKMMCLIQRTRAHDTNMTLIFKNVILRYLFCIALDLEIGPFPSYKGLFTKAN